MYSYIIPTHNNSFSSINPNIKNEEIVCNISFTLITTLNKIKFQLDTLKKKYDNGKKDDVERIEDLLNTYTFIYKNVPGSNYSISKFKTENNIFFELVEIYHSCNMKDFFLDKNIKILSFTQSKKSVNDFLHLVRENKKYQMFTQDFNIETIFKIFVYDKHNMYSNSKAKYDLLIFSLESVDYSCLNDSTYVKNIVLILYLLLRYQENGGVSIIKIGNIYSKPIQDFIYLLSTFFEKVILTKPYVSKIMTNEKYIICKYFINKEFSKNNINNINFNHFVENNLEQLFFQPSTNIVSIIDDVLPYYFVTKIEELNLIIEQKYVETMYDMINLLKNKNDKMELLVKNSIQKGIQWCEKYEIPSNKFIEKINIFLCNKKNSSESDNVRIEILHDHEPLFETEIYMTYSET